MSNWKEFLTRKNVLVLLGLLLVTVALPLATVLVKQSQETRKKAAGCPLGASSRSSVRFVSTAGAPITTANINDKVRLEVNVGAVDAADIVLGFNNGKLEFDTTFGANGIQKSNVGGLTHFGSSGSVDESGTPDVKRILFIVQRAKGATATGGKIATIGFKVKSTTPDDRTQIIFGGLTTLALNGEGGHLECGTGATLTLNGTGPTSTPGGPTNTPVPTATPTVPAGAASFSLTPGSGQVSSGTFKLFVNFNPGGISTNNFSIAYKFDGAKLSCATEAINGVHTTCSASEGEASYIVFDTAGGRTVNSAINIGSVFFTFKESYKSANITYDRAGAGGILAYVYVKNAAGQRMPVSVSDYCYFTTGGTCGPSPTATPTPTPTTGGPTATPTLPAATNTPAPTATPTVPAPTPTFIAEERCRLTVVGGTNHALGETVRIQLFQKPKFPDNDCYYASLAVNVSPGGQTITVPGFSRDARTQEFTWATTGKSAGTYTFSSLYGGHSDNCPNNACCDNSDTCSTSVVLAAAATPTPTVPACPRDILGNLDCSADGRIDSSDLTILLQSWGSPVPIPVPGRRSADIAGADGVVDTADLTKLLQNWGI